MMNQNNGQQDLLQIHPCGEAEEEIVHEKLIRYNNRYITDYAELRFCIRNETGEPVGGIFGCRDLDCLSVRYLYVDEAYRHQGCGGALLRHAEETARAQGAKRVLLSTFSFQAPGFYEKHGYRVCGALSPCLDAHALYFFTKEL